jgi:hypothetical protein
MSTDLAALYVNDARLALGDQNGLLACSPGFAVAEGSRLLLGQPARQRARINPRHSFNRFWSELNQQPLRRPAGRARHHADLAYFHLQSLLAEADDEADEYLLAVPPWLDAAALALLLGVTQSMNVNVTGLVASGLLPGLAAAAPGPVTVLEAGLHSIWETSVAVGDSVSLTDRELLLRQGLAGLDDLWVRHIAQCFVRQARFDPLHEATVEQQLYDALPDGLTRLGDAPAGRMELLAGGRTHGVELQRRDLVAAAESVYEPLRQRIATAEGPVFVDHALARLPGLLDGLDADIRSFTETDLVRAACAAAVDIRSDAAAPAFVTRLPRQSSAARPAPAAAASAPRGPAPTHLLDESGVARRLSEGLLLGSGPGGPVLTREGAWALQPAKAPVSLNGGALSEPAELSCGDVLNCDGRRWTLVHVEA